MTCPHLPPCEPFRCPTWRAGFDQLASGLKHGPTCWNCGGPNHKAWERCPLSEERR